MHAASVDIGPSLIAIVALLAANAFFVAAEFALVKAKTFRVEAAAADGSRSARMTVHIQQHLEPYLAACQLGITMASLGLGWVGEPAVAALLEPLFHKMGMSDAVLHTVSFIAGFLIFSSLHIVVGEQVPKTFAIRKPETVSMWSAYPLRVAYLAVWPLNWALNKASGAILGLFGVEEAGHGEVLTPDELKGLVKASREHGAIQKRKAAMLKNLFEFDERHVGRVMIPRNLLAALDVSASPEDNLEVLRTAPHSRFPLIDSNADEELVGQVLVKDIHVDLLSGVEQPWVDLRKYRRDPLVVPETQRISDLFELMRTKRAHMAMVVDEYGTFVGIVTLEDLLEEIVGEIEDETDAPNAHLRVEQIEDGVWEADGLTSLGDVERDVGVLLPPELDANTLSGLFLHRLSRMPKVGDTIREGAHRFEVLAVEDRHVSRVRVEKLDTGADPVEDDEDAAKAD